MDEESRNLVGGRVRKLRLHLGLSVEELSTRLKNAGTPLSLEQIARIESGKRRVVDYELWGLAKVLRVRVSWLFSAGTYALRRRARASGGRARSR
jgi:transcriptional regulator with XRE-family HTH domain